MAGERSEDGDGVARVLCNIHAPLADDRQVSTGVAWRLAEAGRQLDANLLNLPAGQIIKTHAEPDLDVLVVVIAGTGTLTTDQGALPLTPGALAWLPHGCTRSLCAGAQGMAYLTVHRRRPGMQIQSRPPSPRSRAPNSEP